MDELTMLRKMVEEHDYKAALAIKRTTRSYTNSIDSALFGVVRSNKRKKAGDHYLSEEELIEAIGEIFNRSVRDAAEEAFEGIYSADQLASMIDADQIKQEAFDRVINYQP